MTSYYSMEATVEIFYRSNLLHILIKQQVAGTLKPVNHLAWTS